MNAPKVIIAGSRTFNDYELLKSVCNKLIHERIEIVSGTANGADKLGERYAKEFGHTIKYFPADWNKYGKAAGYKRNAEMAKYSEVLITFWDGKSKGTKHMIKLAKDCKLEIHITIF